MNKKKLLFLFCFFISGFFLGAQNPNATVATFRLTKTEKITLRELNETIDLIEKQTGQTLGSEQKRELLKGMVDARIVHQAAQRDGVTVSDEEVREAVRAYVSQMVGKAMTFGEVEIFLKNNDETYENTAEEMRKQLLTRNYIFKKNGSEIENVAKPTTNEIKEYYNQNSDKFVSPDMVRFSQIFLRTVDDSGRPYSTSEKKTVEARSLDIFNRIKSNPTKFTELVNLYSEEPESKANGGDAGFVPRNDPNLNAQFGASFFNALFEMKAGETDRIPSNVGYHIVKIVDFSKKKFLDINDPVRPGADMTVSDYIIEGLTTQRKQEKLELLTRQLIENLRKSAGITIVDRNLNF